MKTYTLGLRTPKPRAVFLILFALLLGSILNGCASGFIRVTSNPEGAEVSLLRTNSPPLKIGTTPVAISPELYPEAFTDNIQLMVSKESFGTETMIIPKGTFQSQARVHFNLRAPTGSGGACINSDRGTEEVAQGVAEAQRQLLKKNTAEAKRILSNLISRYPNISILHNFLGNAHYLDKDLNNALESYKRARDIQPNNLETARMIEKLQNMRGGGN